jgi:hypothetical protein
VALLFVRKFISNFALNLIREPMDAPLNNSYNMTFRKFYTATLCAASLMVASLSLPLSASADNIGKVTNVMPNACEVIVETEKGVIMITPLNDDIFRVTTKINGDRTRYKKSQSAVLEPQANNVVVSANASQLTMTSPSTKVVVDKATGLISFYNRQGQLAC